MLHFLYNFTWSDETRGSLSRATFAVHVYQFAKKYFIDELVPLAASQFKKSCDPINDVPGFVESIRAIDDCTSAEDTRLWNIAMPLIENNMKRLLGFVEFKTLLREKEDLNFKLLGEMAGAFDAPSSPSP